MNHLHAEVSGRSHPLCRVGGRGALARLALEGGARRLGVAGLAALLALLLATPLVASAQGGDAAPIQYRLTEVWPAATQGSSRLGGSANLIGSALADALDPLASLRLENQLRVLDRRRATVDYAWYSKPGWDMRFGFSTTADSSPARQRFLFTAPDRLRASTLPTMHFSSVGRLSERWLFSVNAEGLRTARGQALDMDLRLDYGLTPRLNLFGGYRLTDATSDALEGIGFLPTNSARLGLRLDF